MGFGDNTDTTSSFVSRTKFVASKKMGQNFLINKNVCKEIVEKINFEGVDLIIEVGPGTGAITDFLVEKQIPTVLIELDKRLFEFISIRYKGLDYVQLINNDVLKINFDEISKKYKKPIIVSNLPYSISSLVIIQFIKSQIPQTFYCMLQKEMVERMLAVPKTSLYNNFTVFLNRYTTIKKLITVSKNNFLPVPEIDSIVISLTKNGNEYDEKYDKFVRLCFLSKRKTIVNNLQNSYPKQKVLDFLIKNNLSPTTRAEELNEQTIYELFNFLC
ncbi:MAG: 16S rRNA (adenine(1518)-N(6)/adenine(1519)-N(6))-dimethyltransferase RsmA [Mycoplasmataceae bacterium]|jgi:16S rRNA (adenine1518-N6/adenine1519-N6)-dimethyltransferase|nr:16S rRNA (adenine(1518)-N(6)/adenine(1519)-N(6))-dimethyltransferase RsmA [Mycoplasmataceae bacterium]